MAYQITQRANDPAGEQAADQRMQLTAVQVVQVMGLHVVVAALTAQSIR